MAVSSSFKQKCPSCEAMVSIKDPSLVGKKVECSKCKYRFVVEDPVEQDKAAVKAAKGDATKGDAANGNGANGNGAKNGNGVKSGNGAQHANGEKNGNGATAKTDPKKRFKDADLGDKDEKPARAKGSPKKPVRDEDDEDADDAPATGKKKKEEAKSGTPLKLILGLALALVGVGLLAVVAVLMLSGGGGTPSKTPIKPGGDTAAPVVEGSKDKPPSKDEQDEKQAPPPVVAAASLSPELTNLIPGDTEHAFRVDIKKLFGLGGELHEAVFDVPGSLANVNFKKRIGFNPVNIADMIRAEKFTGAGWTMSVLFMSEPVIEDDVVKALGLEKKDVPPIKGHAYYKAGKPNPTIDHLSRFSFGVPRQLRLAVAKAPRTLYVRFHNPQTIILADKEPLEQLLQADNHLPELTPRPTAPAPPANTNPMSGVGPGPGVGPGVGPGTVPGVGPGVGPGTSPGTGPGAKPPGSPGGGSPQDLKPGSFKPPGTSSGPSLNLPPDAERASFTSGAAAATSAFQGQTVPGLAPPGGGSAPPGGGSAPPGGGSAPPGGGNKAKDYWNKNVGPAGGKAPPGGGTTPPGGGTTPPGGALTPPGGGLMPPGGGLTPPGGGLTPPGGGLTPPGGDQTGVPAPPPPLNPRDEMWLTIKPGLKAMLDKMEAKAEDPKEHVLYSSATDLEATRIDINAPEFKNTVLRLPRELWDMTYLLEEHKERGGSLGILGTVLIKRDSRTFRLHNELICSREVDAKDHYKHLQEQGAQQLIRFFDKLLDHKIELAKEEKPADQGNNPPNGGFNPGGGFPMPPGGGFPMPPGGGFPMPPGGGFPKPPGGGSTLPGGGSTLPPGGGSTLPGGGSKLPGGGFPMPPGGGQPGGQPAATPPKAKEAPTASQITLNRKDKTIEFTLDLILDPAVLGRMMGIATLAANYVRIQTDLATLKLHHQLAAAAKTAAEKGQSEFGVPPGEYPPGAFMPAEDNRLKSREPKNRVSWMAGLLPYMGQSDLYAQVKTRQSWRDPANWIAGQTIVPQFVDPSYPDASRLVSVAGLPMEYGATHFVGLAGVGLDAPIYNRDDPEFIAKRGVFGYDKSASLKEVAAGRGLSNTIVIIQVPYDGSTGVTPWIAGGGATIRGVPEKNSIAPFVLSKDKNGNVIQHNGKKGTFALMADGSVRFIQETISDDVFKAMATIGGGAPDGFNVVSNKLTPKVEAFAQEAPKYDDTVVVRPPVNAGSGATPANVPAGWVAFNGDGYSVAFPVKPLTKEQDVPEIGKVTVNIALLLTKQTTFTAQSMKPPEALMAQLKAPGGIRKIVEKQLAGIPGLKVAAEKVVAQGSHSGTELTIEGDVAAVGKITNVVRVFIINDQVIQLSVVGPGSAPAEAQPFFDSLQIGNAPPQKANPAGPKTDPARPAVKSTADWVSFKSSDGYSVSMPQQPREDSKDVPELGKVKVAHVEFADRKVDFSVTTMTLSPALAAKAKTPEGLREIAMLPVPKELKGLIKITKEVAVTSGTFRGVEIQSQAEIQGLKVIDITRMFLVNDRLISVSVMGVGSPPPETAFFLDSLKIGN